MENRSRLFISKMLKITSIILFIFTVSFSISFAQVSSSQIIRSQEILEIDKALREKLQEEEKVFIKKISVEGASLLTEDELKEIISPFQKKWLTQTKIQKILGSIREAYIKKGYQNQLLDVSFEIERKELKIKVKEAAKDSANK